MIPKRLEEITADDLKELVQRQRAEDETIDYKSELPDTGGSASHALLADVAALANTHGGDLIYGISEVRDSNSHSTGVPDKVTGLENVNPESERTRLQDAIYRGLDPPLRVGVKIVEGLPDDKKVVIIRVERASKGPLMIRASRRFYVRQGPQNRLLERVDDLRALFAGSTNLAQAVRDFRSERLAMIAQGEGPVPLPDSPILVVHGIPNSMALAPQEFGVETLAEAATPLMRPGKWASRPNLDGYLVTYARGDMAYYAQLFRSGAMEIVDGEPGVDEDRRALAGEYLTRAILSLLKALWEVAQDLEVGLPLSVSVTLMNVAGWQLIGESHFLARLPHRFDRFLVTADVEVADWQESLGPGVQPILDLLWQAAGFRENPYLDEHGERKP